MRVSDLKPLPEDELVVIAMGPGFGESVLVRVPPEEWLVVDSFRKGSDSPVVDALSEFGVTPAAIALTHDHGDHTAGLDQLIENRREGARVGWVATPDVDVWWATPNPKKSVAQGTTEQAVAAIERVWEEDPQSRWDLNESAPEIDFGEAKITVLSPLRAAVDAELKKAKPDLNRISSAMLVTWKNCRIVLGADLTAAGWADVEKQYGPLHFADAAGVKLSHHGSQESQHPVLLGASPRDRPSLCTPFNKGRGVPDFADGQDVDLLLRLTSRIYLTTHHGPLPANSAGQDTLRSQVRVASRDIAGLRVSLAPPPPAPEGCWVAVSFDSEGDVTQVWRGPSSMSIING